MKKIVFEIEPVAKPRMVHSDKWANRKCVTLYWLFKDKLNLLRNLNHYEIGDTLNVIFYLSMPEWWSEKKKQRMDGKPHRQKPDGDNLFKAFTDSLMDSDSNLWNIHILKFWARSGRIEVLI